MKCMTCRNDAVARVKRRDSLGFIWGRTLCPFHFRLFLTGAFNGNGQCLFDFEVESTHASEN